MNLFFLYLTSSLRSFSAVCLHSLCVYPIIGVPPPTQHLLHPPPSSSSLSSVQRVQPGLEHSFSNSCHYFSGDQNEGMCMSLLYVLRYSPLLYSPKEQTEALEGRCLSNSRNATCSNTSKDLCPIHFYISGVPGGSIHGVLGSALSAVSRAAGKRPLKKR